MYDKAYAGDSQNWEVVLERHSTLEPCKNSIQIAVVAGVAKIVEMSCCTMKTETRRQPFHLILAQTTEKCIVL